MLKLVVPLFSAFVNDLPFVLEKARIAMYADDSTVYAAASSVGELNSILQKELTLVFEWVTSNKLVITLKKQSL